MKQRLSFRLLATSLLVLAAASKGRAQTDEIQVYDAAIAPIDAYNLTIHNNFTPSGGRSPAFQGAIVPDKAINGVVEWAYGVTPWAEAGLYFPLYSITRNNGVVYNGMKVRALIVTPDAVKRSFFYGVNFEFSVNTKHWNEKRYTSEVRPIVGAHVGKFDIIFNPIVDNAWKGVSQLEFLPVTRLARAISERYKVALEEYDDFGRVSHFLPASRQTHQLFAVLDINTRLIGIEAGIGAGLSSASDHWVFKLIFSRDL